LQAFNGFMLICWQAFKTKRGDNTWNESTLHAWFTCAAGIKEKACASESG